MNRHIFGGSRANRDRRDASFEKIARDLATPKSPIVRESDDDATDLPTRCCFCGEAPVSADFDPYCSIQCAIDAENS